MKILKLILIFSLSLASYDIKPISFKKQILPALALINSAVQLYWAYYHVANIKHKIDNNEENPSLNLQISWIIQSLCNAILAPSLVFYINKDSFDVNQILSSLAMISGVTFLYEFYNKITQVKKSPSSSKEKDNLFSNLNQIMLLSIIYCMVNKN